MYVCSCFWLRDGAGRAAVDQKYCVTTVRIQFDV